MIVLDADDIGVNNCPDPENNHGDKGWNWGFADGHGEWDQARHNVAYDNERLDDLRSRMSSSALAAGLSQPPTLSALGRNFGDVFTLGGESQIAAACAAGGVFVCREPNGTPAARLIHREVVGEVERRARVARAGTHLLAGRGAGSACAPAFGASPIPNSDSARSSTASASLCFPCFINGSNSCMIWPTADGSRPPSCHC